MNLVICASSDSDAVANKNLYNTMKDILTPAEKEIVRLLKRKAPHAGCFGEMMQMVFSNNEPAEVRQMLADIKSQSYHAPDATAKIIGFKTFLMIIKL